MVLKIEILRACCLDTNWDILMLKCLALMKASKWYLLMVKLLVLYLDMYMESNLGLIFEQIWDLYVGLLMVLMMVSSRDYFLETHWDILMVK